MSNYAVVQKRLEKIDPQVLQSILQEQGGMTHADAARVAYHEQGILWERFSRETAQQVANELIARDFAVRAVATASLPKLEKPRTVHWLKITDKAVQIPWTLNQDTVDIVWSSVFVICAGQVGRIIERMVEQRQPFHEEEGPTVTDVQRQSETVWIADFIGVTESGAYAHIRLPADEMSYDRILGPTDDVKSSFQKFLTVLDALVTHSRSAIVSPQTRRLLVDRKLKPELPRSEAWASLQERELQNHKRWLLQLAIFREQADDPPE